MLNLALVGEHVSPVSDLAGFRKSHRVPHEDSDRSRTFVRRIAAADIGQDLDRRFADFRRELGLKRVQMDVSEPKNGCGTIATPSFRYQISADLSNHDPSLVIWRRSAVGFAATEAILADSFSATFGHTFDTVEFAPDEPVDVETFIDWIEDQSDSPLEHDYDRMATWCRLTAPPQMASTMLIQSHVVSLKSLTACHPNKLIKSFFVFRELLPAIEWSS